MVPGQGGENKLGELLMLRRAELADERAAAAAAEAPAAKLAGATEAAQAALAGEAEAEAEATTRKRHGGDDAGPEDNAEKPARKALRAAPEVVDLRD